VIIFTKLLIKNKPLIFKVLKSFKKGMVNPPEIQENKMIKILK